MKDYVKVLQQTNRASIQRKLPMRMEKKQQWSTLELIEDFAGRLRERLEEVLPAEIDQSIKKVQLDLLQQPVDAPVIVKAQFYRHDVKRFQLRVYVHQQTKKGKGIKLARAVYHLELSRNSRAVA